MRSWKLLWSSLIVLTLALAPKHQLATGAEENADLLPRLGETTSEYEARTRGLARPVPPSSPFSVTLVADAQGHFLADPILNGVRLRMLVDPAPALVPFSRKDARRIGITPVSAVSRAKL